MDMKEQYLTELDCNMIANLKVNASVRKAVHDNIAKHLSRTGLTIAACRLAAQKVLTEALKLRKVSAGKLLGSIATINELDITPDELREQEHGASSEPYFYQTAYTPLQRQSAIPVNEHGQCVIVEEVLDKHGQPYLHRRWKFTLECKLPAEERSRLFVASKTCLNSQSNGCARVLNTLTLIVHMCTACCHFLHIQLMMKMMRSSHLL